MRSGGVLIYVIRSGKVSCRLLLAVDSGTRGTLREAPQLLYSAAPDGIGEERLLSAVMPLDLSAKAGNAFLEGFLQGTA